MTAALLAAGWTLLAQAAVRTPYQEGVAAFESGDLDGARAALEKVDPRREPHASYLLGVISEQRRAYGPAVGFFDRYLAVASPTADLLVSASAHRAWCLAAGRRWAEADRASRALPTDQRDRAVAFLAASTDLVLARQAADRAARRDAATRAAARFDAIVRALEPRNPDGWNGGGLARLALADLKPADRRGHLKAAAAAFRKASELDPRPVFFNNEGTAWLELDDPAAAEAAFARAAKLAPEGDPAHVTAMRGLAKLKDRKSRRQP